jgi:UDP-N-acetylglucosamine--N-acetylmuramyl-(pentapeptide) pyrophosphoryl-undecaprenol N-acetylglucosamine transferase
MKILFTGGGTAGHIIPIVAIARELRKNFSNEAFDFYYVGPKDKFAANLLVKEGIEVKWIFAGKIRRYFSLKNILDVLIMPIGLLQAFYYVFVISPDLIFSKGGYGSIPVVISGWFLLAPIFLHESDITPGLANRIASKYALEIFTAFPAERVEYFPSDKMISVGNPLQQEILKNSDENPKKILGLAGGKPVILFLGGSQGSQRMNDVLLTILSDLVSEFEVIHQTGEDNFNQVSNEANAIIKKTLKKYYHPFPFLGGNSLACAYQSADLVVSRSGAGSLFEIAARALPAILVPLPESAQNHQVKNSYFFGEKGGAIVIEEANFKPRFLLEKIKALFAEPERLKSLKEKIREMAKPDAARIVAEYLENYLNQ